MIKIDSRDFHYYQRYGQTVDFPPELIYDNKSADYVQALGDVRCTAITTCEVTTDKTGIAYDIDELYNRIPHDSTGANPKDAIKAGIEHLRVLNGNTVKPWTSYFKAHTGNFDAFDNVRSAITQSQNSIMIWSGWFREWAGQTILPRGITILSYHCYSIEGWKIINGEPMLQIEAWVGYKMYMSRDVFNDLMNKWSSNSAVLADDILTLTRDKNILETIVDAFKNIVLLIQQKNAITMPPIADPQPIPTPTENKNDVLYNLSKSLIGQHLTLNPTIPKEIGCCQAMSFVLKKFGVNIPNGGISGTANMKEWLDANFTKIDAPRRGSIMIAVSGTGSKPEYRGHVFVYGNEASMSNDSTTGLWKAHWLNENAKVYYGNTLGMPLHYYDPK